MNISVIIPAFNEAPAIESSAHAVSKYLSGRGLTFEIIISDDGSADDTALVVERLCSSWPQLKLSKGPHKGKGAAVKRGVLMSSGRSVLISDADLSAPVEELDKLEQALSRGEDIAIASRALPGSIIKRHQSLFRETAGKALNRLIQKLYLPGIYDTQCGFKLFKGEAARELFAMQNIDGFLFDVEILCLARKKGYKIAEIPVAWEHKEKSKVSVLRHLPEVAADLIRLRKITRST